MTLGFVLPVLSCGVLRRLLLPSTSLGAIAGAAAIWLGVSGPGPQPLFVIERSKNANIVRYDVRLEKNGRYDVRKPLDVYWLMQAEDGRREELTDLERRVAYGYQLLPGAKASEFQVQLVAVKERPVAVRRGQEGFRAEMLIGGAPARLERIFVATKEGKLLPQVLYVEVIGKSTIDGKTVRERIAPK